MSALDLVQRDGEYVVSSQSVADGSGVQHKNVLELLDANRADFEEFGQVAFETRPGYNNSRVRVALLNEQQATLLMTFQRNTDQVRSFKKALVKAFFEIGKRSAPVQESPQQLMARALVEAQRVLSEKDAQIAVLAPKALFADAVASSEDSILVRALANILKQNGLDIGQNRLYERLRDEGYLCKSGESWNRPTQRAMDLGLFEVIERTGQASDGTPEVRLTTKVTGKGQQYFIDRYTQHDGVLVPELV